MENTCTRFKPPSEQRVNWPMRAPHWRERRKEYLQERGRLADLIREGYIESPLAIIAGGGQRRERGPSRLQLVKTSSEKHCDLSRGTRTPTGEPAA